MNLRAVMAGQWLGIINLVGMGYGGRVPCTLSLTRNAFGLGRA